MDDKPEKKKMTIIVFSGELDKALASFILATTAGSMGMEVTMFFTFWGLNVLKKNEGPIRSPGVMRRMLNRMNRGGTKRLHLSRFHMMGAGTAMIKKLMAESNIPQLEELMRMAKDLGVKFIVCTTSCGMMGLDVRNPDAFRTELIDGYAGAATYLGAATDAEVNLFI
jgi:peroxiredoxin family protein